MNPTRKESWAVFGLPAAVSLLLSLSIMGNRVHWQDSGFFLAGIHELSVLYPHGFVLYQLAAWLWTKGVFFLDFTLAVHLFSAVCISAAAGTLSLASLAFLKSRWFPGPGDRAPWAAAGAGILWATGYTVASAGTMAKGYPLLFLVLALLLLAGIRTAETGSGRAWTGFAVLIGLSWAAHPSAALLGPCLVAWVWSFARPLGTRGILWRTGVAAVVAAGPALVALPLMASRSRIRDLGHPVWGAALLEYFTGGRYTLPGESWGVDAERVSVMLRIAWEELLPVGLGLLVLGAVVLNRRCRSSLGWLLAWTVPFLLVTLLFRIEGQMDFWMVAAGVPWVLAGAAGLNFLGVRAGERGRLWISVLVAGGATWAVGANHADLDLRGYTLAEDYGRLYLAPLEPRAILLTSRDDVVGSLAYLQAVRGERRDVLTFGWGRLADVAGGRPWFDEILLRDYPELAMPDYRGFARSAGSEGDWVWTRAFLEANRGCGRPFYLTHVEHPHVLPEGWEAIPAGVVWRLAPKGTVDARPEHFRFDREPESVRGLYRRSRGIELFREPGRLQVRYEPYERRLAKAVLQARQNLAEWHFKRGGTSQALRLMESVIAFEPELPLNPWPLQLLGLCHMAGGDEGRARTFLELALDRSVHPWVDAVSLIALGDLARRQGRMEEARRRYEEAASLRGLSEAHRTELRTRLSPR